MDGSFRRAVAEARRQRGLYFASLLSEERIDEAFGITRALWQGWVYTPAGTGNMPVPHFRSPRLNHRQFLAFRTSRVRILGDVRSAAGCIVLLGEPLFFHLLHVLNLRLHKLLERQEYRTAAGTRRVAVE